jgi:hypothetical protein
MHIISILEKYPILPNPIKTSSLLTQHSKQPTRRKSSKNKLKYNKTKRDITLAISHPKLQLKSPRRKIISLGGCNK